MAKNKRVYDDDDGRTIADMSGVERQRMLIPRMPKRQGDAAPQQEAAQKPERQKLSRSEGRAYVFGAMGAALLIGSIFVVAFFLFIVIFLAVYR